jgi:uncharacterized protein YfkK (UPF0435 family)
VSGEKPIIEINTQEVTNTIIQLRVDAYTKALWQFKLSLKQKRAVKKAIIRLIKEYAGLQLPEPKEDNVNIVINTVVPDTQEVKQNDIELLTKELDITKRKLNLCEEEIKVLRWENKKVKECEDKLNKCEVKLEQIKEKINLYKKGVVTDPKQVINLIDKILSQA